MHRLAAFVSPLCLALIACPDAEQRAERARTQAVEALARGDRGSERRQVAVGRIAVATVLGATFLLSQFVDASIFRLGIWSFTGFAALFPLVVAALYWRRSTALGALAGLVTVGVLWAWFLHRSWTTGVTMLGDGIMPVAVLVAASSLAVVIGSLATPPPPQERIEMFFDPQPRTSTSGS